MSFVNYLLYLILSQAQPTEDYTYIFAFSFLFYLSFFSSKQSFFSVRVYKNDKKYFTVEEWALTNNFAITAEKIKRKATPAQQVRLLQQLSFVPQ